MISPVKFIQQTRAEVAKVVWPNRRELVVTTVMVLILVAILSTFFTIVDIIIRSGLTGLLGLVG